MSEVLVGSAYGLMQLRYEQFTQGVAVVDQQIQRLQALSKTPITFQAQLGGAGSTGAGAAAGGGAAPRASGGAGASPGAQATEYDRLVRATAALEAQQARLARSQGDTARAAQLEAQAQQHLTGILAAQESTTVQSIAVERQLATVQQQSERAAQQHAKSLDAAIARSQQIGSAVQGGGKQQDFGAEAINQFKSSLVGIVAPAALVAVGIGAATRAVESFGEAFKFKAQLDSTNAAIAISLQGIRDSGATFREAGAFADRYKLTQEETSAAIQASIPILRTSNASLTDVESTLLRLQAKKPEKSIADAARALDELKAGQIVSIVDQFNVSRDAANKMKNEIAAGGDAVKILSDYLNTAGFGMAALEIRTKGATGALHDAEVASENLKIAQGKIAESAGGIFFVQSLSRQYQGLANLLNGDALAGLQATGRELQVSAAYTAAYTAALAATGDQAEAYTQAQAAATAQTAAFTAGQGSASGGTWDLTTAVKASADALTAEGLKKLDSTIATAQLSAQQAQLDRDSQLAAQGMLGAGDQALILSKKYGIAADQAQFLINQQQQLSNATALADQRKGEQTGTTNTAAEFNKFSDLARQGAIEAAAEKKKADDKAAAEAQRLQDSRDALALSRARTSAQKIAIYQQELARTTDAADRNRILAQIEGEKRSGTGRVSAAQSTALQLNNIEENSGLQLAKTQRENQERLARQAEDFALHRSRAEEDYAEQRRSLLAHGQRAQAAQLAQEFAKTQRRAQEDFDIQKHRTLRDTTESVGDIGARTDLRQAQIGQRAALRGVRTSGGVDLGQAPPQLQGAIGGGRAAPQQVATLTIQGVLQIDGKAAGQAVWPTIAVLVDEELAITVQQIAPPGSGQAAVGGNG